jgi:hypothetical protein
VIGGKMQPPELKPVLIVALRGAEAPLFHVTARFHVFFRNQ